MQPQFVIIDLFCGAGGTTTGFAMAGGIARVIACVNHDAKAIESHWANYPDVRHYTEDIRTLDLTNLRNYTRLQRLEYPDAKLILWASLECTNFSKAKGGQPRDADSRTLADHLHRYVEALNPDYVQIENVVEFMSWGPLDDAGKPLSRRNGRDFMRWCSAMDAHGYRHEWRELNSADFGAYTSRNRLFGIFALPELPIAWPQPTHGKKVSTGMFGSLQPWKAVKDVLDFSNEGQSIFGRKTPLVEKTLERVYAGLVKFVAGGKDAFLAKLYATASNGHGTYSTESAAHTITTRDAHALVQPAFLSKYYGGNPDFKNTSLETPAGTLRCKDGQALVQTAFIQQRNNRTDPATTTFSVERPARTVTTTGGNMELVQPQFMLQYNGFKPESNVFSTAQPMRTLTASHGAKHNLVSTEFFAQYYVTLNICDTDGPAPTLTTKYRVALVQAKRFIDKQYGSGPGNQIAIEQPAGTITGNDHHALISTQDAFITATNFSNSPTSVDLPLGTITANRKWHYLVNPSWGGNPGATDAPCPVIVARQDKAPLYIVISEQGDIAIRMDETDSPCMRKIKEFMVLYAIVDIRMRMLMVDELLRIQGFPDGYKLAGTQSDQKKFIGNSVVPQIPKCWIEAMNGSFVTVQSVTA